MDCGWREGGHSLDFIRAEPATTQRPTADGHRCFFEISVPKASTVMKERMEHTREFMRHVPGMWGSQPNGGFEKERAMSSLPVCHSSQALFGITEQYSKEGLSGDCWCESRFHLFTNEEVNIFHVRVQSRMGLPFLIPD